MIEERFIIYGRSTCPYCVYAMDYCTAKNIEYVFLDYSDRLDILEECKKFYNQNTVPIILANNTQSGKVKKIGGYTDLLDFLK